MIDARTMLRLPVGFAAFLVVGTTCSAQFYHRMGPPPSHYDLLKASDLCAIVTLVGDETVSRRLSRRQLEERTDDLVMTLGGARLRLRIDEYLCSAEDLTAAEPSAPSSDEIEIFRARDEVDYFSLYYLAQGRQGLLCAEVRRDQDRIRSDFKLPDDRIYYRSSFGGYGLRPLDGDAPQRLLSQMSALCKALRGKTLDEKLAALRALQADATEPFAESVRQAIDTVAASRIRK